MKRPLLPTKAFDRSARRAIRRNPARAEDVQAALELLAQDAFHSALKTHKLKGALAGSWACSAGYDLRIVFQFVSHEGSEAVLLEGVGSHEEVY